MSTKDFWKEFWTLAKPIPGAVLLVAWLATVALMRFAWAMVRLIPTIPAVYRYARGERQLARELRIERGQRDCERLNRILNPHLYLGK